jgi:peptidoglycan-associated lipoprotein
MNMKMTRMAVLAAGFTALGLAGCSQYVKQTDFQQLQQTVQEQGNTLKTQQSEIDSIKQQMASQFSKYDAAITAMQGRVKVDTVAHFAFDSAELNEQDKPALQDFAQTIAKYHPNVLITVEGFTDPAGSRSNNKKLGLERANAVRDFLVSSGLSDSQVRAVSYGKDSNRQVTKGATRDQGADNRRVALTVDSTGASSSSNSMGQSS